MKVRLSMMLAGALACGGLTGCAGEQEALVILNATVWEDSECRANPDAEVLLSGTLDLSFGSGYVMALALKNNLVSNQGSNQGIDTSEVQLLDAEVQLELPQAPQVIARVAAQNEALVDFRAPLATNSLGPQDIVGIGVEAVSQPAAIALRDAVQAEFPGVSPPPSLTLLAHVVVKASRTGNNVGKIGLLESRQYTFPITICEGCLLSCSECPMGACPESTSYVGGACGNAQDLPLVPTACAEAM